MENNNYDDLKDDNSIINKQEYELKNQKADKFTNISNTLINILQNCNMLG